MIQHSQALLHAQQADDHHSSLHGGVETRRDLKECLQHLAGEQLQRHAELARIGSDEFAILLRKVNTAAAQEQAERLSRTVRSACTPESICWFSTRAFAIVKPR